MDLSPAACIGRVRQILALARTQTLRAVNAAMVAAYWEIGREIVEEEQRGKGRADYGSALIEQLSRALTNELGRGFSIGNLRLIRQFYLTYQDRVPIIRDSVSRELPDTASAGEEKGGADAGFGQEEPARTTATGGAAC